MKKKYLLAFLFALIVTLGFVFSPTSAKAEEGYDQFQEIKYKDNVIVTYMLYWKENRVDQYFEQYLPNKKAFGWQTFYTYKDVEFTFIEETLYEVSNDSSDGTITHNFKYEESDENTIKRKTTGSLGGSQSLSINKFKFGLEEQLSFSTEYTSKTQSTKTDSIKVDVPPKTKLVIDVRGEGKFYQGVARKMFMWFPIRKGGFEYVIITTRYYAIHTYDLGANTNEE